MTHKSMTNDLHTKFNFNFTRVGVGFFFNGDTYTVERIHRKQFVTHPCTSKMNVDCDVFANLTFRVGLESTSKTVNNLNNISFLQETHPYINQRNWNYFLFY